MSAYLKVVIGYAAGAATSYVLTRRYLEGKFQKRLDEAVLNADEFYRLKYEHKLDELREKMGVEELIKQDVEKATETDWEKWTETLTPDASEKVEVEREPAEEKTPETIIDEAGLKGTMTNYGAMFQGEMAPSPHVKKVVAESKAQTADEPATEVVTISEEEYFESSTGFVQHQRTYYAGDNVLANEINEAIPESIVRSTLGAEIMEKLVMGLEGDAEVLYVRNKSLRLEFEIYRDSGLHSEVTVPDGSAG